MKEKIEAKRLDIQGDVETVEEKKSKEKKFGQNINEYLRERGIEAPPISIHIFYSGHSYGGDLRGFYELFKAADIVIPEAFGWKEKNLKDYRDVASGKMNKDVITYLPSEVPNISFDREFLMTLYGTNKKIVLIDAPRESKMIDDVNDFDRENKSFIRSLGAKNVEETIAQFRELEIRKARVVVSVRDEYMLEQLGLKTADLLNENPELLKKDKLSVLLILGATHTGVYHELKARERWEASVSRSFRDVPQLYHYSAEVLRRLRFGKPVSDELLLKDLLESILSNKRSGVFVVKRPNSSAEYLNGLQSAVERFSIDEIKLLLNRLRKPNFDEYLDEVLRRKGIIKN